MSSGDTGDKLAQKPAHAVEAPWTAERLRAFEQSIFDAAVRGEIVAALHLSRGNESQLLDIFQHIRPRDWVFSTWRNHYHALLHGLPEEYVRAEIFAGRSISLNSAKHRFFTSSIVGGCLPIAVGVAMAIKRSGGKRRVWCFVGDMAASCGMFHDCTQFAAGHQLPITFVVEDNSYSTNTPTDETWGARGRPDIRLYHYQREFPHSGVRQR